MSRELTKVSDKIHLLDLKIKEMKDIETTKWLTPGKVTMQGGVVDIRSETSIEKLVMANANIIHSTQKMEESYKDLGIDEYPVPIVDGGNREDWKHDILLKIKIIGHKDFLDKLKSAKKRYEDLMDKEDKKALLDKEMEDLLK